MTAKIAIRRVEDRDMAAVQAVYAHHVLHGTASFETEPPDVAEVARRCQGVLALGLPYLVAELDGRLVGYAYAGLYRPRAAYRFTCEDSVYVAAEMTGQGIGLPLLMAVIEQAGLAGMRQMVAVIGDSANHASIGLHTALGFRMVGKIEGAGFKHGRWVDSVLMQRPLGPGISTPPAA